MKLVSVEEAVGLVLAHDVTEIKPQPKVKHSAFRRGHIIEPDDIPRLLDLGKRHLYVAEPEADAVHENDGAERLARAVAGTGLSASGAREGKVKLTARHDGYVHVVKDGLARLNALGDVVCVTRRSYHRVREGDEVAAARVMPLFTTEETIARAEAIGCDYAYIVSVRPPIRFRAGLVVTGSEVVSGRVQDAFEPVIRRKLAELGSEVVAVSFSDDQSQEVETNIRGHLGRDCDLVIVTGGMSVDPDDRTPAAIRSVADHVAFQWAPALPGCMNMVGTLSRDGSEFPIPILGVPACGIHHERTVLDLILLRLVAREIPTTEDLQQFGHGGLCLECEDCHFPNCSFGSV